MTAIEAAIAQACGRIAPLWPLRHFVAVNPFLGFTDESFAATCAIMRRVAQTDILMPRPFWRSALAEGTITDDDLAAALTETPPLLPVPRSPSGLRAAIAQDAPDAGRAGAVATVAEVLDRLSDGDRQISRTGFMVDEISKFCAAYFDEGQAVWRLPQRGLGLFEAWHEAARHDRNAEAMGIAGFRKAISGLPRAPVAAIAAVAAALSIPDRALPEYLHRALFDIGGWASYARHRVWLAELDGRADDTLVQLLALRVAWGYGLFVARTGTPSGARFELAWQMAMQAAASPPDDSDLSQDPELALDLVMQTAFESAHRRTLLRRLAAGSPTAPADRPALQVAFCIDVRSEPIRRALETVSPTTATIGFAGFFGFPIEYIPIGRRSGGAQCPVLLKPAFTVCEAVGDATMEEEQEIMGLRLLRRRAGQAWKSFKLSAVSSFAYVETLGLGFAVKLVSDSLGLTRPVRDPDTDGLDPSVIGRIGPRIAPREVGGRATGFDPAERAAMAEAVLRAMSMTTGFARLVLLAGHGSTTVNNPHASSLDCGACGGHTGEANARVAAAVLNDEAVRTALATRGIAIPADTWFLPALHDTTTDDVRLFDTGAVPRSHTADIALAQTWLRRAAALARTWRAPDLGLAAGTDTTQALRARAVDWSQVRPEWGLAGNRAFIAAPRAATRGRDLGGEVFLHDYDWRQDPDLSVLTLIMTAPLIVASWINLQYYACVVNHRAFGAGNKALHNVCGAIGVLEGNAGDLKAGLPWQSVHDGTRFRHDPLRLTVIIAAPTDAMDSVIAAHDSVRRLVENGWVHLFAMTDGPVTHRYAGPGQWRDNV